MKSTSCKPTIREQQFSIGQKLIDLVNVVTVLLRTQNYTGHHFILFKERFQPIIFQDEDLSSDSSVPNRILIDQPVRKLWVKVTGYFPQLVHESKEKRLSVMRVNRLTSRIRTVNLYLMSHRPVIRCCLWFLVMFTVVTSLKHGQSNSDSY